MFKIPSTFADENESYLTMPVMRRFAADKKNQELKTTVDRPTIISDNEWRMEYMTLLMRDEEKRMEGMERALTILDRRKSFSNESADETAAVIGCTVQEVLKVMEHMVRAWNWDANFLNPGVTGVFDSSFHTSIQQECISYNPRFEIFLPLILVNVHIVSI